LRRQPSPALCPRRPAVKPVAPKIGEVVKGAADPEVTMRRERDVAELRATIEASARVPQEKWSRPVTVAQVRGRGGGEEA
jgi:hypothetical protein